MTYEESRSFQTADLFLFDRIGFVFDPYRSAVVTQYGCDTKAKVQRHRDRFRRFASNVRLLRKQHREDAKHRQTRLAGSQV